MKVIKRDGKIEEYDFQKIERAVNKAFKSCKKEANEKLMNQLKEEFERFIEKCEGVCEVPVDDIKDIIENFLIKKNQYDVVKASILERNRKDKAREQKSKLVKSIREKLAARNIQNQNANVDEASFGGRMGEASRVVTKEMALDYCMSEMAKNNHYNNEIYIHDLDSYAVGMHNCAARETKFCTAYYGVRSFQECNDGDRVAVLTPSGNFENATVKKFGVQKLNKITFSFAGQRFVTERFTSNHRWILEDGSETTNLKIGDRLYKAPIDIRKFNWENANDDEKYYWCLGFVLADGTEVYRWSHGIKNEEIKFVRLRLCGDKTKYESRFESIKHSTKELENGDLYLTFSSTIGFRKKLPSLSNLGWSEKLALFDGIYCADGQQSGSRKSILTSNEEIASFIEDEAPSLGWFILNVNDKTGEETNYKIREFAKEYTFIGDSNKYFWTVVDITEDKEEEVWCLEVEREHAFVLPNGITTGNCLTVPFDKLLAEGFNTRQTDVRPANSVNTAFQLVAVIFQLQSLQQFGGVSASHIDWTMVPYVRKSFMKHYKDGLKYFKGEDFPDLPDIPIEEMSIEHIWYGKYNSDYAHVYEYAMDMTVREIYQAVEGMYHNLNTLQSRSGKNNFDCRLAA